VASTEDHKASREDERARIEALGGHVDDFTGRGGCRVSMAVTPGVRGDSHLKVIHHECPGDAARVVLESKDDFIVLASDGGSGMW